jgi:hypothetical protein
MKPTNKDRRLTVVGRVTRLSKNTAHGACFLSFWLTVDRAPRPTKVLRVCGEIWGSQLAMAEQIEEGSVVTLTGCIKDPDPTAVIPLPRFDLEQVLGVA